MKETQQAQSFTGVIAWFARNDVAANLLMLSILAFGIYSIYNRIPLEVFPSIERNIVNVNVSLPGTSPEEVEEGVTIRVEEAVQDLEGIKEITSRSAEGSARISIEADSDYDVREMMEDIKGRVDSIPTLPDSAEKPRISISQFKREVISLVVYGEVDERELRSVAEVLRDQLTAVDGITQVTMEGVANHEISIEVSEQTLKNYNLTLQQVSDAIRQSSLDLSAGNIRTQGGDILVRSRNQAFSGDDFADIVIVTHKDGSQILLRDLAHIRDGFEEVPVRVRFNGAPAIEIEVFSIGNESAIETAEKVFAFMDEKRAQMPQGISLGYWRDRSTIVKARLNTLTWNALQGGFLVMLLLTLFLRPAVAFWVVIGIPVCFMGAFALMPVFGVTINILSLFGFIIVLGIVVDDAIVTGENVYTHLQRGTDPLIASIKGTKEIAIPVTFGILTTVAAFLPLAFMEGRRAIFFQQIPLVVIPVLLFSLIESKFVLPAHLKHVRKRDHNKLGRLSRMQVAVAQSLERFIEKIYQPLLQKALAFRWTTLALLFGILLITLAMVHSGWTRYIFFPRIQSEVATASLTMPVGTSFATTDYFVQEISTKAKELQQKYVDPDTGKSVIMHVLSSTGSRGGQGNVGRVRFEIVPPEKRTVDVNSRQLVNEWRKLVGNVPGAESLNYRAEIGRGGDPIDVRLMATDIKQLEQVAEEVKQQLSLYPEIFDIQDSLSNGKEELQFLLKPEAHSLGISVAALARQVRQAFFGAEVQRIQRGRDEVRIFVRYPKKARYSLSTLDSLLIRLPNGAEVPFSEIATVQPGRSPASSGTARRRRALRRSRPRWRRSDSRRSSPPRSRTRR